MIYLIITTSINNKVGVQHPEHRKQTYLGCIRHTLSLLPQGIKPIIVENNGQMSTYLDQLPCDVHYTDNNQYHCPHKGVNELLDIKSVIEKYAIKDDDVIIKLTGRYAPLKNDIFRLVIDYPNYDAYIKFFNVCTLKFMEMDCVLGFYAVRAKYMKQFSYSDYTKSPEVEFATFMRQNVEKEKIFAIQNLHLRCCFADDLRILDV